MQTKFYKDTEGHFYAVHEDGRVLHVNTARKLVNELINDWHQVPDLPNAEHREIDQDEFSDALVNVFLDMGAHKYLKLPV